jgi:hypothetical protein
VSVLDSQEDIAEAKARLEAATDERLLTDLAYWHVAATDHGAEFRKLAEREQQVRIQHAEAEHMASLVGSEIRRRRDVKRQGAE